MDDIDDAVKNRLEKSAYDGKNDYTVTLCDGRITVHAYSDGKSKSYGFPGNKDNFDRFSVYCPEAWMNIASDMMSERWGK